jgi:hypothetical protein
MSARAARHIPLALIPILSVGCAPTPAPTAPSPLGSDTELYCEWDVNDQVPSPTVCAAAGIDTIEIAFFLPGEPEAFTSADLRFPCEAGFYDSGTVRHLAAGALQYRWRAYEGDEIVLESKLYSATAIAGGELTLQAVNFPRLIPIAPTVSLRWQGDLAYGSCSDALAETMSWELRKGTNVGPLEASDPGGPCTTSLPIPDLPVGSITSGTHVLIIDGAATDGAIWHSECVVVFPDGGPVALDCDVSRAP